MRKLFYLLVLFLPTFFIGCKNGNSTIDNRPLTASQLDSIRHKEVNDSINNLDTIKIMKVLFMGMTPEEYKNSTKQYSTFLQIGRLKYWHPDTVVYHNTIHDIHLKAHDEEHADDLDDMKYKIEAGEETFSEAVRALSKKYGPPTYKYGLTKLDDKGFQTGYALWEFEKFSVVYEQNQKADLRSNKHWINAKIKYSIPRIPTKEEKQRTDSIVNAIEKQKLIEKRRNEEALKGL